MKKNILFIGNSYTYFWDMPEQIFAPMAAEAGQDFDVRAFTRGGYFLCWYADPDNEEGRRLRAFLEGRRFDCVVLQDNSLSPLTEPGKFFSGCRDMRDLLRDQTEHFVLYATWGRKTGCETLTELGMTSQEMTRFIAEQYDEAGRRLSIPVSHVGLAFEAYTAEHPEAELYYTDLHHPSPLGSTVAAQALLKTITAVLN